MKRFLVFVPVALSIAVVLAPSASAGGWTRCGQSLNAKGIGCPKARAAAHDFLRLYYRPITQYPPKKPRGFDCGGELLKVGRFDHTSCSRTVDGVRQQVRFFFNGRHLGGPRHYWHRCGIRSRAHGNSCAKAREVALHFLEHRERGDKDPAHTDLYYCLIQPWREHYGPIVCVRPVGLKSQRKFTEWRFQFSFEELNRH